MDPQSVSTFKPTRYNAVYVSNPGSPSMVLIGMRRGEVGIHGKDRLFLSHCGINA